jgi:membrane protein DedA with SNARE-associated domain
MTGPLTDAIGSSAVIAVFALMAVDALLPVGGELIMLYAGVVAAGVIGGADVSLLGATIGSGLPAYLVLVVTGTVGYTMGGLIGWWIGRAGGHPFLDRHGRWLHLSPERVERAEAWFDRHGSSSVLIGRLTPIVRSFISVPAGVFAIPLGRYLALTFAAGLIWCLAFAGAGWAAGGSWESFHHSFGHVEILFGVLIVAALAVIGIVVMRSRRREAAKVRQDA